MLRILVSTGSAARSHVDGVSRDKMRRGTEKEEQKMKRGQEARLANKQDGKWQYALPTASATPTETLG